MIESWQRGFGGEVAEGRQFDGGTVRSSSGVALDDREAGWMGDGGGRGDGELDRVHTAVQCRTTSR
jgi:hypothetical protein